MQMKKFHDISDPKFEDGFLVITIDGEAQRFPLKEVSPVLEKASEEERSNFEISPSGYGIHWPLLRASGTFLGFTVCGFGLI
jgi:hypothetical protein